MIKIGILGAAGYTGGELIRLLLNHPEAEIVFANSESNAGNPVADIHEGLYGDTNLRFTSEMPFDDVDVVFFCFGHGKSEAFLREHTIPSHVKIIDLAQDFRLRSSGVQESGSSDITPLHHDFVYGLPEIHRAEIAAAQHVANPGCFATCIQLALLPAAKLGLLTSDVCVNAITGSTGAGQKPGATTHFSWRNNNLSIYKAFSHQHLHEICQSLNEVRPADASFITSPIDNTSLPSERVGGGRCSIDFIPYRGDFARGIFATAVIRIPKGAGVPSSQASNDMIAAYKAFYKDAAFTHYVDKPIDLKQVVNTNKCLVHTDIYGDKLLVTAAIDNLLKGAVGQAVQNMNLLFGIDETAGLRLKASAF